VAPLQLLVNSKTACEEICFTFCCLWCDNTVVDFLPSDFDRGVCYVIRGGDGCLLERVVKSSTVV
jgi:hypothetical protein